MAPAPKHWRPWALTELFPCAASWSVCVCVRETPAQHGLGGMDPQTVCPGAEARWNTWTT